MPSGPHGVSASQTDVVTVESSSRPAPWSRYAAIIKAKSVMDPSTWRLAVRHRVASVMAASSRATASGAAPIACRTWTTPWASRGLWCRLTRAQHGGQQRPSADRVNEGRAAGMEDVGVPFASRVVASTGSTSSLSGAAFRRASNLAVQTDSARSWLSPRRSRGRRLS